MPYGYIIANIDITNPEQMAQYRILSTQAVIEYGGEFIVRGGQQQVLEGRAFARTAVIRFATYEKAKNFYDSVQYRAARQVREGAGQFNMLCVEGLA